MTYILLGSVSFVLFFIYDVNCVTINNKLLHKGFAVGFILLAAATAGLIADSFGYGGAALLRTSLFGTLAVFFLVLLVYTLFFALPFAETYILSKDTKKVCQTGMYALCRHPGVLWFACFYFSLWIALMEPLLLTAAFVFTTLNVLYVIFQDRWTFPRYFSDYGTYKKNTPFIIPTYQSISNCLKTMRFERRYQGEI